MVDRSDARRVRESEHSPASRKGALLIGVRAVDDPNDHAPRLGRARASGNDFPHDLSMHIGQPEVPAGIAVGQARVIKA